jgi:hypothetical protein
MTVQSGKCGRHTPRPILVIASEPKQSIAPHEGRMDCRVASLLAMTRHALLISRRDAPEVLQRTLLL